MGGWTHLGPLILCLVVNRESDAASRRRAMWAQRPLLHSPAGKPVRALLRVPHIRCASAVLMACCEMRRVSQTGRPTVRSDGPRNGPRTAPRGKRAAAVKARHSHPVAGGGRRAVPPAAVVAAAAIGPARIGRRTAMKTRTRRRRRWWVLAWVANSLENEART